MSKPEDDQRFKVTPWMRELMQKHSSRDEKRTSALKDFVAHLEECASQEVLMKPDNWGDPETFSQFTERLQAQAAKALSLPVELLKQPVSEITVTVPTAVIAGVTEASLHGRWPNRAWVRFPATREVLA